VIRRARIRSELDLSIRFPQDSLSHVQAARHAEGAVLTFCSKDDAASQFFEVTSSGEVRDFNPGWPFPDGVIAAVDPMGRIAAWRWSGDRVVRRYAKAELDATYPLAMTEVMHDLAFFPDGRMVAAGGKALAIFTERAIPQRDLARLVKKGPWISVDVAGSIFALSRDGKLLRLDENGTVEREGETGLLRPDTVRVAAERVWCADTVSGELLATTPHGHPAAAADVGDLGVRALVGRSMAAHSDGSVSIVGYGEHGPKLVTLE
jgi:hypothetical protein